jgi:hypothetical protein
MMDECEVKERTSELVALPVGWDSYHADCQPVAPLTAIRARRLIRAIGVLPENVVPISSNDPSGSWVQVEWYPEGRYIEIEVDPSGTFNYMLTDRPMTTARIRERLSFDRVVETARLALKLAAPLPG